MRADVTIVVATYDRPDALAFALRSLARQTHAAWRAIVVGDGCDARTGEAVAAIGDPRVDYVNLPERFGEQSGPNSVGLTLADTPFLGFLNHDDLLLPDHLEVLLRRLSETGADFAMSRAARVARDPDAAPATPLFYGATGRRAFVDLFRGASDAMDFEPASSWVFRRAVFERVGPWPPAARSHRTPMNDWLLRAWRLGVRFEKLSEITVVRVGSHRQHAGRNIYARPADVHPALDAMLASGDARAAVKAALRRDAGRKFRMAAHNPAARRPAPRRGGLRGRLRRRLLNLWTARLFRRTGWDAAVLADRLAGVPPGQAFAARSLRRTGAPLPPPPRLDDAVAAARAQLRDAT